jgi:hypothetical protein
VTEMPFMCEKLMKQEEGWENIKMDLLQYLYSIIITKTVMIIHSNWNVIQVILYIFFTQRRLLPKRLFKYLW